MIVYGVLGCCVVYYDVVWCIAVYSGMHVYCFYIYYSIICNFSLSLSLSLSVCFREPLSMRLCVYVCIIACLGIIFLIARLLNLDSEVIRIQKQNPKKTKVKLVFKKQKQFKCKNIIEEANKPSQMHGN